MLTKKGKADGRYKAIKRDKVIRFRISHEARATLIQYCSVNDTNISDVIRAALNAYLQHNK
jgi:hypothetical protein